MPKVAAEQLALDALAGLLREPSAKVLHGSKTSPGIFAGGSAAEKVAARLCVDNRWLEPTGEAVGKSKTRKELYRITEAGLRLVLERGDPTQLLRNLTESLAAVESRAAAIPQAIQDGFAGVIRQVETLKAELNKSLGEALHPLQAFQSVSQLLKSSISQVLEKVKPVDVAELTQKLGNVGPPPQKAAPKHEEWGDEVVRMAAEQKQRNVFQRLTLPQIFEKLRSKHPDLTLGQFHDGLRRLQDDKRIRLGPYTQALATLDDPRNALFLDREVKYYVELS